MDDTRIMLASTTSNQSQRPTRANFRLPTALLAPRTCCHHGHGSSNRGDNEQEDDDGQDDRDSLLPDRIDRLALGNDDELTQDVSASRLSGTQFFSSVLLPSIVRLPAIPQGLDSPTPGEPLDIQPYWSLFKQVQAIRSTLNQHVIDRAFHTYAHDRPAYHAEFQQVMSQALATLGTIHGLLRQAGLLPQAGAGNQMLWPERGIAEDWGNLCQHVRNVQELERERMSITIKWQGLLAESLHGTRDVQQEADQVKRLRDAIVDQINDALEEAQAWYAELKE